MKKQGIPLIEYYFGSEEMHMVPDFFRSVEVVIAEINDAVSETVRDQVNATYDPELFDYLYFTIYTITTTGYGDIVPITSMAECISSIANILEIFYIVIFFNALLSPSFSKDLSERVATEVIMKIQRGEHKRPRKS